MNKELIQYLDKYGLTLAQSKQIESLLCDLEKKYIKAIKYSDYSCAMLCRFYIRFYRLILDYYGKK